MEESKAIQNKIMDLSDFYDKYDIGEHEEDWKEISYEIDLKENQFIIMVNYKTLQSLMKLKKNSGKSSSELIEDLVEKAVI